INKKRRKATKKRFAIFVSFILVIVVLIAGNWTRELLKMDRAMEAQKNELYEMKQERLAQNEELRKEIEMLNTPSYIEQLAREKLGLVRKGEIVVAPKKAE
ncbi:MAG: septum formation initiator family protein, partial [Eubacteriales bacterium]